MSMSFCAPRPRNLSNSITKWSKLLTCFIFSKCINFTKSTKFCNKLSCLFKLFQTNSNQSNSYTIDQPRSNSIRNSKRTLKYIHIFQILSKYIQEFQTLSIDVNIYQIIQAFHSLLQFPPAHHQYQNSQNLYDSMNIFQNMSHYVSIFQIPSESIKFDEHLHTFIKLW